MKKRIIGTMTMISVLFVLAALSVNAQQMSENSIAVNIPFDFAVGETKLPAGKYTLRRIDLTSSYDRLVIQSADGHGGTDTIMTRPNRVSETQKKSRLVFNRYGDQYFLAQVWAAGSDTGHELFPSCSERSLAKDVAREVARSKAKPQQVTLSSSER